jgi:hypothetical protein
MIDPIRELKIRAELLHHRIEANDPSALGRLRSAAEFQPHLIDGGAGAARSRIRRHHCLATIAKEFGFDGWSHATSVISGDPNAVDFGTLLYPKHCCGFLNLWYRRYEDARDGLRASGGYLLAYRRDFVVVDRSFIQTMGLDPALPEWRLIGFDWARPHSWKARTALYGALIASRPREVRW